MSFFDEVDEASSAAPTDRPRRVPVAAAAAAGAAVAPGGARRPPSDQQSIQARRPIAAGVDLVVLILIASGSTAAR